MAKVELTAQQAEWRVELEGAVKRLRAHISHKEVLNHEEVRKIHFKMGEVAHKLHMSLDPHPKHHAFIIENRGMEPTDPEFYVHTIHPAEYLLKYLDDTSANDDPEDVTIGAEFYMNIYSRKIGYYDRYTVERIATGWRVEHMSYAGYCDKEASPVLYDAMQHDSIVWPSGVRFLMERIWQRAKDEGWSREQVQHQLDRVAAYISETERNFPDDITL